MERLGDDVRARIGRALPAWSRRDEARAFIEVVVWQRAHALTESSPGDSSATEGELATRVLSLVEASVGGALAGQRAAAELAADPALLAAFFQNLDLLPAEPDPQVDMLVSMVGEAVRQLAERREDGEVP